MTIYEKISNGYYDTKLPYVTYNKDKKANIAYHNDQNRLVELFKKDALKEVGLANHPKSDKIYAKAWENGHSAGYNEVLNHLKDLAELFEDELDKW